MRWCCCLIFVLACGGATAPAQPPAVTNAKPAAAPAPEPIGVPAGYVEMHAAKVVALGDGAAVLLVDEKMGVALPIFIGGTEGASIDSRMRGDKPPRPLTHDLLDSVLARLGGALVKVQIDALINGVFHGSIFVRAQGRVHQIDARSSDAVALAIGARVPIYVALAVIAEAGLTPEELRRHLGQPPTDGT